MASNEMELLKGEARWTEPPEERWAEPADWRGELEEFEWRVENAIIDYLVHYLDWPERLAQEEVDDVKQELGKKWTRGKDAT